MDCNFIFSALSINFGGSFSFNINTSLEAAQKSNVGILFSGLNMFLGKVEYCEDPVLQCCVCVSVLNEYMLKPYIRVTSLYVCKCLCD